MNYLWVQEALRNKIIDTLPSVFWRECYSNKDKVLLLKLNPDGSIKLIIGADNAG